MWKKRLVWVGVGVGVGVDFFKPESESLKSGRLRTTALAGSAPGRPVVALTSMWCPLKFCGAPGRSVVPQAPSRCIYQGFPQVAIMAQSRTSITTLKHIMHDKTTITYKFMLHIRTHRTRTQLGRRCESCDRKTEPVTCLGSPFQEAAALYGKSRRAAASRNRGNSRTAGMTHQGQGHDPCDLLLDPPLRSSVGT